MNKSYMFTKLTIYLFSDIPVWSKLQTGRIPQPVELFQIIDNYLMFDSTYSS